MNTEDGAEKEFEPSERRLEQARERGEVPRSADLTGAAALAGFVLAAAVFGPWTAERLGTAGRALLAGADRLAAAATSQGQPLAGGVLATAGTALSPFILLPMLGAVLALVVQRAVTFTPGKLAPRLARISPLAALRQKFGREGLFDFAKSCMKLVLTASILGLVLVAALPRTLASAALDPGPAAAEMWRQVMLFLLPAGAMAGVVGAADLLWQHAQHRRRHRMSRRELLDELKASEGDPQLKAARRQRAVGIATNRMLDDVRQADVVIVNPTHYAVALRWDRGRRGAPVCVAKGVDAVAARIRDRAAEAGVPLHRDPPTARALHASVAIGEEVRPEHYRAVAAAIRFAEALRRRRAWPGRRR